MHLVHWDDFVVRTSHRFWPGLLSSVRGIWRKRSIRNAWWSRNRMVILDYQWNISRTFWNWIWHLCMFMFVFVGEWFMCWLNGSGWYMKYDDKIVINECLNIVSLIFTQNIFCINYMLSSRCYRQSGHTRRENLLTWWDSRTCSHHLFKIILL